MAASPKPKRKKSAKKKAAKRKPAKKKKNTSIPEPNGNLLGNKRTVGQRERDLMDIADLSLRGHNSVDIARRITESDGRDYKITYDMVLNDMKTIFSRWESECVESIERSKAKQMRRLDKLLDEAWEAWDKSKTDKVKQTQKKVSAEDGDRDESTVTIEAQAGSPALLGKIIDIIDRQNRILGIYDMEAPLAIPQKIDYHMTFEHADPSPEILARQKRAEGVIDIEAKILDAQNPET